MLPGINTGMLDPTGKIITLHRAADFLLPLTVREDGTAVDGSSDDLRFIVEEADIVIVPALDPNNPFGRLIHFTKAHAAALGSKTYEFILRFRVGDIDTVLWDGTIRATGMAVAG